jgi:hypothetical protein
MLRIISIIIILSFTSCEKTFVEPIKKQVISKEIKKPVKKIKKKKKFSLKKFFNKKVVSCHKQLK